VPIIIAESVLEYGLDLGALRPKESLEDAGARTGRRQAVAGGVRPRYLITRKPGPGAGASGV